MSRLVVLLVAQAVVAGGQSLSTARLLEQAGQKDRAWIAYRRAVESQPTNGAAYEGLHRLSVELGFHDSLLAVSRVLLGRDSSRADVRLGIADALLGLQRRAEGIAVCRLLVALRPDMASRVIDLLLRWEEYGEASDDLAALRRVRGDPLFLADRLAETYRRQGRHVEAAREIVALVNNRPGLLTEYLPVLASGSVAGETGMLLRVLDSISDRWARARAKGEVLLAVDRQEDAVAVVRRGMSDAEQDVFAQECEDKGALEAALELYRDRDSPADQARVMRKMGDTETALALLAADRSPAAQFEVAEMRRIVRHDFRGAAEAYEVVLRSEPGHHGALHGLAASHLGLGLVDSAREALLRLRATEARDLMLHVRIFFVEGNFDSAQAYALELVRRSPTSPLANEALEMAVLARTAKAGERIAHVMMLIETGALADAEAECRALIPIREASGEAGYFLLATVLRLRGKPAEAIGVLDTLLADYGTSARRPRAMYRQALIARDDLGDDGTYRAKLQALILEFPDSPYAAVARGLMADAAIPVTPAGTR